MRGKGSSAAGRVFLFVLVLILGLSASPVWAGRFESEAYLRKAQSAISAKNDMDAVDPLKHAIQADPSYDKPYVALADLYDGFRKYGDAAKLMETATKLSPSSATYLFRLGKYRYLDQDSKAAEARKYDGAITALNKAVKIDGKLKEAYYFLGQAYFDKGDYANAIAQFEKASDIDSGNLTYRFALAKAQYKENKVPAARENLQLIISKLSSSKSPPYDDATQLLQQITDGERSAMLKKVGVVAVPVAVVALVLGFLGLAAARRRAAHNEPLNIAPDTANYEDICASTLQRLCGMTEMAYGIMMVTNVDGDQLVPKAMANVDDERIIEMRLDTHELPRWIERNDGKPFLFATEKKEGIFIKAFPDVRDMMEPLEMRIGVPFVHQEKLLGMAFLGIEQKKDILKLKKRYERNQLDIFRLSIEVSNALSHLHEDELAYVDVVTKFKSRKYVEENVPRALVNAEDAGKKGVLLVFEYDQFRQLEEQYGETHAETVLKTVAEDIKGVFTEKPDHILARLEAGRFFGYLPVLNADDARNVAKDVYDRIAAARISRNLPSPTGSVGCAIFPDHGRKADDLIWSAERVMMGIAAAGGNNVGFAEPINMQEEYGMMGQRKEPQKSTSTGFVPGMPSTAPPPPAAETPRPAGGPPPWIPGGGAPSAPLTPPPTLAPPAPAVGSPPSLLAPAPPAAPVSPLGVPPAPTLGPQIPSLVPPAVGSPMGSMPPPPPVATPGMGVPPPVGSIGIAPPPAGMGMPPPPVMGTGLGMPPPAPSLAVPPPAPGIGMPPPAPLIGAPPPSNGDPSAPSAPSRVPSWMKNPLENASLPATPPAAGAPPPSFAPPGPAAVTPFAPPAPPDGARRLLAPKGPTAGAARSPFGRRSETAADAAGSNGADSAADVSAVSPMRLSANRSAVPPPPAIPAGANEMQYLDVPPTPHAPIAPWAAAAAPAPSRSPEQIDAAGFVLTAHILSVLDAQVSKALAANEPCSLVYCRLDQHEALEKQMGPQGFQGLLHNMSITILDFIKPETDIPGRLADDSFVIVLPRTSARIASNLAEQVRLTLSSMLAPGLDTPPTVSVGIAAYPEHGNSAGEVLGCAKRAATAVQGRGGNGIQLYDSSL